MHKIITFVAFFAMACLTNECAFTLEYNWGSKPFDNQEDIRLAVQKWAETRDISLLTTSTLIDKDNPDSIKLTLGDYGNINDIPKMKVSVVKVKPLNKYDQDKYSKSNIVGVLNGGKKHLVFIQVPTHILEIQLYNNTPNDDDQWNTAFPITLYNGKWYIAGKTIIDAK